MTADTLTLAEWLLARIAEDEAVAREQSGGRYEEDNPIFGCRSQGDHVGMAPARVLAECEAKRRIVELYRLTEEPGLDADAWAVMKNTIRALALPYADHVDFREEWRA